MSHPSDDISLGDILDLFEEDEIEPLVDLHWPDDEECHRIFLETMPQPSRASSPC